MSDRVMKKTHNYWEIKYADLKHENERLTLTVDGFRKQYEYWKDQAEQLHELIDETVNVLNGGVPR
jgi:hypothetical protein|tara:strand:+ start:419 stop:616 length:198 start_codon:yes stop_codon:yes gene_type:complete